MERAKRTLVAQLDEYLRFKLSQLVRIIEWAMPRQKPAFRVYDK